MKAEQAWQAAQGQLQLEIPKAAYRYMGARMQHFFFV